MGFPAHPEQGTQTVTWSYSEFNAPTLRYARVKMATLIENGHVPEFQGGR